MVAVVQGLILIGVGLAFFALSLLSRRRIPGVENTPTEPWSSTLSYVATAYGVVIGFSILFLFGEYSSARQAVGEEATSIGTAFEEAALFAEDGEIVQNALICYSRAVPTYDWPANRAGGSAPEVDQAFSDLVGSLGMVEEPADGTFQPSATTNILVQISGISTARETRIVAATTSLPPMLWILLYGGGFLVIGIIFVVTMKAPPRIQGLLVGLSATFTAVMILIVSGLSNPFGEGSARVKPTLIQQTTMQMEASSPAAAAMPCPTDLAD